MSSTFHDGEASGSRAGKIAELGKKANVPVNFQVDPIEDYDWDYPAFTIYLLGHDAVAGHDIRMTPSDTQGLYDIDWRGRIALAYVGEDQFNYSFRARIEAVQPPYTII